MLALIMKKFILLILFYTQLIGCSLVKNTNEYDPCDDYFQSTKSNYKTLEKTDLDSNNLEFTIRSYQDSSIIQEPIIYIIETESTDTIQILNEGYSKLNLKDGLYSLVITKDEFQSFMIDKIQLSKDSIKIINILLGPDCNHIIEELDLKTW
jgi:hypothetical protein